MKKLAHTSIALAALRFLASMACWFGAVWSAVLKWPAATADAFGASGFLGLMFTFAFGAAGWVSWAEAQKKDKA